MVQDLQGYYLRKDEPNRSCLLALRESFLSKTSMILKLESMEALLLLQEKMFCYLWTNKKSHEPYIIMVEGKF
jgi:hypothetical protein